MRVVDFSGRAAPAAAVASPGEPQRSARLLDALGARRARQQARADDLLAVSAQVVSTARKTGAKHAVSELTADLGDDWILVRGYQNSAGGIGQLLVGAHGVVAMTSLHLDATVHCHADKWHAESFGKDGRSVGEHSLDDRAGRSPSTHLNQAADVLETFLRSGGVEITVLRAILLNHPRSRLEGSRRATVQIFTSHLDLSTWLRQLPKTLDRGQRRKIEQLLTNRDEGHSPEQ